MATPKHDFAVIGAGIVGVCTALHLQMAGHKVTLIDRRDPGQETSYGNAGIIEDSYVLPYGFPNLLQSIEVLFDRSVGVRLHWPTVIKHAGWLWDFYRQSNARSMRHNGQALRPLLDASIKEHRKLMQLADAEKLTRAGGYVRVYRNENGYRRGLNEQALARELGIPFEVFEAADFRAIEPDMHPIYHKAVRWPGNLCVTNPGSLVTAYVVRFAQDGGKLVNASVSGLRPVEAGWEVETHTGSIHATQVVLCAGPWSARLAAKLGYDFPLGFKRGYHRHFHALNGAKLHHAISDAGIGYVIAPMEKGLRITTGAEFADLDAPQRPDQLFRALKHARELFPLGSPAEDEIWHGWRPCFADSLPAIGPAPAHPGLWLNFGHGHSGLTLAAVSGRLLAEMVRGMKPFCDPTPYSPARFAD